MLNQIPVVWEDIYRVRVRLFARCKNRCESCGTPNDIGVGCDRLKGRRLFCVLTDPDKSDINNWRVYCDECRSMPSPLPTAKPVADQLEMLFDSPDQITEAAWS